MKKVISLFLIVLFATLSINAADKKVTLKLGLEHEGTHPYGQAMDHFAKLAKDKSGGTLEIQIFPSSQLGNATEMVEGLQIGSIDMVLTAVGYYKSLFKALDLLNVPFLITSEKQFEKVMAGKVGQTLNNKLDNNGIINLGYYWGGARHFTNNRSPINSVADFKNLKIRSIPSKPVILAFTAFGAQPVTIGFSELYGALQTGIVDAQDNPLAQIYSSAFYEVQKYLSLSSYIVTALNLTISKRAINKLSTTQQKAIKEAALETIEWNSKNIAKEESLLIKKLEDGGMKVNTVQDLKSFQVIVEGLYDQIKVMIDSPDSDWVIQECVAAR